MIFNVNNYFIEPSTTKYKRRPKPPGYWKNKENQKAFFDQLAVKWNFQNKDDWNKVTEEMVLKEGGYFLKTHYPSLPRGTNTS
jgi:hypothetical protein